MTPPAVRPPVVLPRRRAVALVAAVAVTVAVAGVALVLAVLGIVRADPPPAPASTSSSPAVTAGIARILDGRDYYVGTNLEPGLYRQASSSPACAWRVSDPITDDTIEEGRPGTGLATVNLAAGTRFRADGCGPWVDAP